MLTILDDMAANSRVRIIGFTMAVTSTTQVEDFYDLLDTMRGLDEQGGNLDHAVASGTITGLGTITGAWLAEMNARYPDITITYEHITSNLYYYSWDGLTLLHTDSITDGGNGTWSGTPARTSTAQYNYTFVGWSRYTDQSTNDPTARQNVVADRSIYAAYTATVRTYTVRFLNIDNSVLQTFNSVPYGDSVTYTGATPVHPTAPDDYEFVGFNPDGTNIQGNTNCVAVYMYTGIITRKIVERTISGPYERSDVTEIGTGAFAFCTSLTTVSFPSVTSIGNSAFTSCSALTTVSFPVATSIGGYAFQNCSALTTASFPAATTIGTGAFASCTSLTTVSFPAATTIGSSAFNNCFSLTTASFPECTTIEDTAFQNCATLTTAVFPAATGIGVNAFQNCYSLTTVSFPVATSIGNSAFTSCSALTTASFPSVTSIRGNAFRQCYNLISLYLMNSVVCNLSNSNAFNSTPIGGYSASAGQYGSIYVPSSLLTSYQTATNWTYFASRFVGI